MAMRSSSSVNPKEKTVKICVVGPKGCGKSSVTRAMADWNPKTMRYTPTAGVRIQEVERNIANCPHTWSVQIWDCSGDYRFKDCWPAMAKDAQGLFIVYNTDADEDNQKEIERWHKVFAGPNKLSDAACRVVGLTTNVNLINTSPYCLQGKLQNIAHQHTYLDDDESRDQLFHALDWILAAISSNDPPNNDLPSKNLLRKSSSKIRAEVASTFKVNRVKCRKKLLI